MPDFSFFDILIFFFIFFLIFRKLFQMSGPKSTQPTADDNPGLPNKTESLIESIITQSIQPKREQVINDDLDEPVYKEQMDIPEPHWKEPEDAFEEGKPEFHSIAAPEKVESMNKDFLFHEATLSDQDVFKSTEEPASKSQSPLNNDWMTPENLKRSFILKEILDPPVSRRSHY